MNTHNQPTLYILYEEHHWDMPLSGLGRYNDQLIWFYCDDEFVVDENTGERLSHKEAAQRNRLIDDILDQRDRTGYEPEIEQQLNEVGEPTMTRIYSIHKLSPINKLAALYRKRLFEFFVGKHWSWDKVEPGEQKHYFKMNRWFGLGRLLFKLYFRKNKVQRSHEKIQKHIKRYKNNQIIDYIRLEDCELGKPKK